MWCSSFFRGQHLLPFLAVTIEQPLPIVNPKPPGGLVEQEKIIQEYLFLFLRNKQFTCVLRIAINEEKGLGLSSKIQDQCSVESIRISPWGEKLCLQCQKQLSKNPYNPVKIIFHKLECEVVWWCCQLSKHQYTVTDHRVLSFPLLGSVEVLVYLLNDGNWMSLVWLCIAGTHYWFWSIWGHIFSGSHWGCWLSMFMAGSKRHVRVFVWRGQLLSNRKCCLGSFSALKMADEWCLFLWMQAIALLQKNLDNAKASLEVLVADLQFLRDQVTITQVVFMCIGEVSLSVWSSTRWVNACLEG